MDRYVFIIVVIVIVMGFSLLNNYFKFKSRSDKSLKNLDSRLAKLEDLEERIQVLEKIVTDKKYNLRQEIDDL